MQMCSIRFCAPFPRSTMMLEKYIWNLSTDPSIPGFSFCKYQSLREDYMMLRGRVGIQMAKWEGEVAIS